MALKWKDESLVSLQNLLRGTRTHTLATPGHGGWDGFPDSPLDKERRNHLRREDGSAWGQTPIDRAWTHAVVSLVAAADHLDLLASACHRGSEPPVLAHLVAMRVSLETVSHAWWLLDPGLDAAQRGRRGIAIEVDGLRARLRIMRSIEEVHPSATGNDDAENTRRLLGEVYAEAASLGSKLMINGKTGDPENVDPNLPGSGALMADLVHEAANVDFGVALFDQLSGVIHGRTPTLRESIVWGPEPSAPAAVATWESLMLAGHIVLLAHTATVDRAAAYAGWPTTEWFGWRQHTIATLQGFGFTRLVGSTTQVQ